MIDAKQTLTGTINTSQSLTGELNKTTEYIQPALQEKEVTPTKEKQTITADKGVYGLSKVIVDKIPDEYIIPAETINITSNGVYDVSDKANANVDIPEKKFGTKTINKNGTYKASDDELDGYNEVSIEVEGEKNMLQEYVEKNGSARNLFYYTFVEDLSFIEGLDTSKLVDGFRMFSYCSNLKTIPFLDCSSLNNLQQMFSETTNIENIGGFGNLGKGFDPTKSDKYNSYKLDISKMEKLTHESLMNIINNLYDLKSAGIKNQQVLLGSVNYNKLTAEERQIGVAKGWYIEII